VSVYWVRDPDAPTVPFLVRAPTSEQLRAAFSDLPQLAEDTARHGSDVAELLQLARRPLLNGHQGPRSAAGARPAPGGAGASAGRVLSTPRRTAAVTASVPPLGAEFVAATMPAGMFGPGVIKGWEVIGTEDGGGGTDARPQVASAAPTRPRSCSAAAMRSAGSGTWRPRRGGGAPVGRGS
jgi:hypothetical protein